MKQLSLVFWLKNLNLDIKAVKDIKKKILDTPIKPKPICSSLEYIYGWNEYATPWLTDPPLTNHSNYNSFKWQKEEDSVKFRAKRLPQDCEFVPRAGIERRNTFLSH